MDTKKNKGYVPIKPYDDSMWDRYSMYDRMTYVWDPDLNVEKIYKKFSGNIIKSYRCRIEEPYELKHE